ncbi:MAG TPA: hypothetical protein VGZ93_03755 [Candidatus Methylacidiphilales bacterium]|jgi:hypothetical protein|nr:hypothetical protein [Candidatus Methylacidiphilales bacterium]
MDTFSQAIAVVAAICLGVFAVAIFLTVFNYLKNLIGGTSGHILVAQDFIKKDSTVTVHLNGGETIESVKFIGFTTSNNQGKDRVPFTLLKMAVFENSDRERIFIPSVNIKFIKETPSPSPSSST